MGESTGTLGSNRQPSRNMQHLPPRQCAWLYSMLHWLAVGSTCDMCDLCDMVKRIPQEQLHHRHSARSAVMGLAVHPTQHICATHLLAVVFMKEEVAAPPALPTAGAGAAASGIWVVLCCSFVALCCRHCCTAAAAAWSCCWHAGRMKPAPAPLRQAAHARGHQLQDDAQVRPVAAACEGFCTRTWHLLPLFW